MKVVIAHRNGQARVVDLPDPQLAGNCVMVRVSHAAMRLPEELFQVADAASLTPKGQDGFTIGSCASGTIVDVGPTVKTLKGGLRVAVTGAPYVFHSTLLMVPESLAVELPKKVNHEEGSFAGQGAIAMNIVRTAHVQLGEVVLVHGADLIGLMAAQIARAAGAVPILVDESEYRLNKARAVGISHTFVPGDDQIIRAIDTLTHGQGVDSALLTRTDGGEAFQDACVYLREGGCLVLGATISEPLPLMELRAKKISLRSASGGGAAPVDPTADWDEETIPRSLARWTQRENMLCFSNLLGDRRIQVSPLVTDRIPIERAPMAYEKAMRSRDAVLGVVLTM